jgi:hypothetical protein
MKVSDKPRHHPEATYQPVAEEAIIVKLSTGTYYSLNDTGTVFWELIDGQRSIADCARTIAVEYDVDLEMVEADLLELAVEFEQEGLIVV